MNKTQLRILINHWDWVWYHYRSDRQLLTKDKLVLKLLKPGPTLAWNSLGLRYQPWCSDLVIHEDLLNQTPTLSAPFMNIMVLNVFEMRYQTVTEIGQQLITLCNNLLPMGRLIFGINSIFINWNRTAYSLTEVMDTLVTHLEDCGRLKMTYKMLQPFETDALNGDCFFIFDKTLL